MYDGRDTFLEGVQAGRLDHGLWELIPLGESVREEALLTNGHSGSVSSKII